MNGEKASCRLHKAAISYYLAGVNDLLSQRPIRNRQVELRSYELTSTIYTMIPSKTEQDYAAHSMQQVAIDGQELMVRACEVPTTPIAYPEKAEWKASR
jgi:hypothetical protein